MPTTLIRGANSFFVNDDDAEAFAKGAPGFQRTHVVADSGHSVQGDQPAALVAHPQGRPRRLTFRSSGLRVTLSMTAPTEPAEPLTPAETPGTADTHGDARAATPDARPSPPSGWPLTELIPVRKKDA